MNAVVALSSEIGHESGYAKGVAVAVVTQNQDEEGLCRVKVRYPWHDKPLESYWARLAVPMAGDGRGTVFIPEVGDEVLVAFEREDPRFPYVLGGLWGEDKPPVANDDGKNDKRIVKSRKHHYLLFDDGAQGVVELAHENGAMVRFTDNEIELKDAQGNQHKDRKERHHHTSGQHAAQHQGRGNNDRSDWHARTQSQCDAHRARRRSSTSTEGKTAWAGRRAPHEHHEPRYSARARARLPDRDQWFAGVACRFGHPCVPAGRWS
ncbi:MAG: phage baseplate assembly protein V [Burkholderiales bacterium]